MKLLREHIRELVHEQNVLALGMCFPFAVEKAEEWFGDHYTPPDDPEDSGVNHPDLNNMDKFKVVHGKVTDKWKKPPKPIVHAWVEMGDLVFDDQTSHGDMSDGVPKDVYYDMYQPEIVNEFTAEEALTKCTMSGYEGPWDEDLLGTLRQRDSWLNDGLIREEAEYRGSTNESILRECIRELLTEKDNSAGPGFKFIYRGMKIDMPTANLASQIRKIARNKPSGLSEREAGSFIMAQLKNEEIGESWTTNMDVASSFADVWSATNRGKTLHIMFWGKIPNDFGYDPTTTGDEPWMFEDESEVRIPKGEEIEITSINVFIADKRSGKNAYKFRPVAYSMGKVKA